MKFIIAVLVAAVVALSVLQGVTQKTLHDRSAAATQSTCRAVQKVDNTLIGLVRQSEKTLPSFAYYKANPGDLVKALAADEKAIVALTPPKYC